MQDKIDTKALAYAQKHEERCLGKVSPNIYGHVKRVINGRRVTKVTNRIIDGATFVPMYRKERVSIYLRNYYIKNFLSENLNSWRDYI